MILAFTLISCGAQHSNQRGPKGYTGSTGDIGEIGAPGVDGKDRGTTYNGEGAPENGIGDNNDLYIDDSSGDLFKKINSVWIKQGNIKGPDGDKGDTGEKGSTGIGEKGDKGDVSNPTYEILCEDTLPGLALYKFSYYVLYIDSGLVFSSAVIYDDEDTYGNGSRYFHSSHADYLEAKIDLRFDKQQNDNWGFYSVGAERDTLDYIVDYTDATDGNENYDVSSKCVKTIF